MKTVFEDHKDPSKWGHLHKTKTIQMKTTRIASLFAITLSIALAGSASALPASKRIGPAASSGKSVTSSAPVEHKAMSNVGPPGKGYRCTR